MWQAQVRRSGLGVVLGGFLVVSATGVGTSLLEDTAVAAVYDLVTAAGQDLPAVVSENSASRHKQEIIGGSVTLRQNRTFYWTTRYRYTEGRRVTLNESSGHGTYKVEGDDITFSQEPGSSRLIGKLKGHTLSLKVDVELVYKRE
jgi:hypothetical protein